MATHRIDQIPPLQQWANKTDLGLLRKQKLSLIEVIGVQQGHHRNDLEGILNWMDSFQDILVDSYGVNPKMVYGEDY